MGELHGKTADWCGRSWRGGNSKAKPCASAWRQTRPTVSNSWPASVPRSVVGMEGMDTRIAASAMSVNAKNAAQSAGWRSGLARSKPARTDACRTASGGAGARGSAAPPRSAAATATISSGQRGKASMRRGPSTPCRHAQQAPGAGAGRGAARCTKCSARKSRRHSDRRRRPASPCAARDRSRARPAGRRSCARNSPRRPENFGQGMTAGISGAPPNQLRAVSAVRIGICGTRRATTPSSRAASTTTACSTAAAARAAPDARWPRRSTFAGREATRRSTNGAARVRSAPPAPAPPAAARVLARVGLLARDFAQGKPQQPEQGEKGEIAGIGEKAEHE